MDEKIIHYCYYCFPHCQDISTWPVDSGTSCRFLGKPTWENLGSLFYKQNYYHYIIDKLLNSDQNLFNVIHFCESNPNAVQIEIAKRKDGHFYAGHHIFASSSVDLTKFVDSQSVTAISADTKVTVKWICNYGQEQEAPLDQFLTMIRDLETDPQKCGITYKETIVYEGAFMKTFSDTYEEHKHLSFILDLRRYCGDVSRFSYDAVKYESKELLIHYVNTFHKKYIVPNKPPSQQVVCNFLRTLGHRSNDCRYINKDLNWDNVKKWDAQLGPLIKVFNQVLPGFIFEISLPPSCDRVKSATERLQQFKAFQEKQHAVQNAGNLVRQIKSAPIDDSVIFTIYGQLFNILIIKDLKDPDSKAINILPFLFQNVQRNGVVASISVPDSGGKRLILVVNNLVDVKEDELKPLLFDLIKRKGVPDPFAKSRFSLLFDNKIHADLGSVEAFNLFKTIVPDENVDRIDGIVVTEQKIRETAAETWTEGVTAATRFLMLSHMFLTHYYDTDDYKNLIKIECDRELKHLIKWSTESLTSVRESLDQFVAVDRLQYRIERVSLYLFQLSKCLEHILPVLPEGIEPYAASLKELNLVLASIIDSKKLPKK